MGRRAGPALRLQRRRERALRPARDRAVRARPEPALLRQPARLHVPAARRVRRAGSAAARASSHAFATDPDRGLRRRARRRPPSSATLAVGLLYLAGARLFDRRVGLLAAALLAVAFLPVFYSHLALNDVPDARAARALAVGHGRRPAPRARCATTRSPASASAWRARRSTPAGIVLLPLLAAAAAARRAAARGAAGGAPARRARRLVLAGAARARRVPRRQPVRAARLRRVPRRAATTRPRPPSDDAGKLGLDRRPAGQLYYLWTLTWGLGWVPLARRARRRGRAARAATAALALVLVPAPVALRALHGHAGALLRPLAAAGLPVALPARRLGASSRGAEAARAPRAALRPALVALGGRAAAAARGSSLASTTDRSCSRADTRNLARDWMVAHVPPRTKIVVEPVVPDAWAQDIGRPSRRRRTAPAGSSSRRAARTSRNDGSRVPGDGRIVNIEDYERTLFPGLVDRYEQQRLLLGRQRLDAVRAARWPSREVPQAIALLPGAERARRRRLPREPVPRRREAGRVQLRLVVRLLPARLRAARAGDDDLPAARRRMRARRRGLMAQSAILDSQACSAPTPTTLHLARAIELAERGAGRASPNPLVGAVVVARRRRCSARAGTTRYGGPHAEVTAIAACGDADLRGATLYVSLEPCCHHGQHAAVHRRDPRGRHRAASSSPPTTRPRRPPAAASGSCATRASRSCVADGELAAARPAAQPGLPQARAHRPPAGALQVGDDARRQGRHPHRRLEVDLRRGAAARVAHRWRAEFDAVAVGIGTALADDPQLTARIEGVAPPAAPRRLRLRGAPAARLAARRAARRGPADRRRLARRAAHRRPTRSRPPAPRSSSPPARTSPARVRSALDQLGARGHHRRSCSRAARTSPARSSTPARSTRSACSSRRSCSAAARARDPLEGEGVERDRRGAARAARSTCERVGDDVLITARLREW